MTEQEEEGEENQQLDIKLRVKGGKKKPIVGKVLFSILCIGGIAWVIFRKIRREPVIPLTAAQLEEQLDIKSTLDTEKNGVFGLVKPTDGKE